MTSRTRSIRHVAAVALAFAWLAADCACSEKASVALPRGSACERGLLTTEDVAGVLRGPITGAERLSEDRESCAFTTGGHSRFEVTLRPSHGAKTVASWIDGGMVLEAVPLHGVGDRAAWQRDLYEVIAEKNDVLCDIAVMGTEGDFVDSSEYVLEARIGDLCNKLLGSTRSHTVVDNCYSRRKFMHIEHTARQRSAKSMRFVALAAAICTMAMSAPTPARAFSPDCTAATKAATLQSKTPFHATYIVTPTTPGAFPTEHHEDTWVGETRYTKLDDGRWMHVPVTNNPMGGFTGPLTGFSDCRPLPAASIGGEMATGYDFRMESGRRTKIWISPTSGLPVRYIVDQDILLVTIDVDYANVKAPA